MRYFMLGVLSVVVTLSLISASPQTSAFSGDQRTGYISGKTFEQRKVTYSVIDGMAIFEGDIALGTAKEMEADGRVGTQAVATPDTGRRWSGQTMPWTAEAGVRTNALTAINMWRVSTGNAIDFPERTAA